MADINKTLALTTEEMLQNYERISADVAQACHDCGRDPNELRLMLVTKTVSADRVRPAFEAGHRLFGENKVQELLQKVEGLGEPEAEFHFIGHLQSNKAKRCVEVAKMIHSVDRISIAKAIHRHATNLNKTMDVLIQVNTSNEESKFGISPEMAMDLTRRVAEFSSLRIRGLMTLAKFSSEEDVVRKCFQKLRMVATEIRGAKIPGVEMRELSMGMSGDYRIAIEEGATIVRVGTSIFGKRPTSDAFYWPKSGK